MHRLKQERRLSTADSGGADGDAVVRKKPLEVHGVRLVELTERTSSVMQGSEIDDYASRDPVVNVLYTFGALNNVAVSGAVSVVPESSYAETLAGKASSLSSDLVLIPWSETGHMSEEGASPLQRGGEDRFAAGPHNQFILDALASATSNTAVFVNRGFGGASRDEPPTGLSRVVSGLSLRSLRDGADVAKAPAADRSHHIYFPFFGGADDHVALRFVLQLAQNPNVTATIVHVDAAAAAEDAPPEVQTIAADEDKGTADPTKAAVGTAAGTAAAPVDAAGGDAAFFASMSASLPRPLENRVVFETIRSTQPLKDTVARAKTEVGLSRRNAGDLVVVGRARSSRRGLRKELTDVLSSLGKASTAAGETRESLGDLAEALLEAEVKASLLVVQAAIKGKAK